MKDSKFFPLLVLIGILVLNIFLIKPTNAQTPISGTLNDTLFLAQSPYIVVVDITVGAGDTLYIEAGVVILFETPAMDMFIYGTLIAPGTLAQPITFTSDEAIPAPGDWGKIKFIGTGANEGLGTLSYCNIYYGGSASALNRTVESSGGASITMINCKVENNTTGVYVPSTDLISINNCSFSDNTVYGIDIITGSSQSSIINSVFTNNGVGGISLLGSSGSYPDMSGSTFSGNGLGAVLIRGTFDSGGTWVADHLVIADVTILAGATMDLDPGITVTIEDPADDILVNGTLNGNGVIGNPIIFTSDEAVPAPGDWGKIRFNGTGANEGLGTLSYCNIYYGGSASALNRAVESFSGAFFTMISCMVANNTTGVYVPSTDYISINNCSFSDNTAYGIDIITGSGQSSITNSVFTNNGQGGINLLGSSGSYPDMSGSTFSGNGLGAVLIRGTFNSGGTWVADHLVIADVTILAGATMDLDPGITVTIEDPADDILVNGTLNGNGVIGNPIIFTSDEAVPAPGDWGKIRFNGTSANEGLGTLSYCNIYYGGSASALNRAVESFSGAFITMINCMVANNTTGVYVPSTDLISINNCSFSDNTAYGINIITGSGQSSIINSVFTNNGVGGINLLGSSGSYPDMSGSTFSGNGLGAVLIRGNFISGGTWVADHLVDADVTILAGATMDLDPGITVTFEKPADDILVNGTFNGNGVSGYPIIFTSDEAVPAPGDWGKIRFNGTSANEGLGTLSHCNFYYGGSASALNRMIECFSGAFITMTNCSVMNSNGDGIYVGSTSDALLSPDNCISGNQGFGVNNTNTSIIVNAENNWWGDVTGPYDNSNTDGQGLLNPGGLGDAVSEYVDWSPFLLTNVRINEFMAKNMSTLSDFRVEYDDWIEIHNISGDTVNIGNYYISKDKTPAERYLIPNTYPDSTSILPNGFLVLYADDETQQGVLHLDFTLPEDTGGIFLYHPDNLTLLDSIRYSQQYSDTSYGRFPNGDPIWYMMSSPTPHKSNILSPKFLILQNDTIKDGETQCYDATNTVTIAGGGTSYVVESNGTLTVIAKEKINILYGFKAENGCYFNARISDIGCTLPLAPSILSNSEIDINTDEISTDRITAVNTLDKNNILIYPNPTKDIIYLEFEYDEFINSQYQISLYDLFGRQVYTKEFESYSDSMIDLSSMSNGIYIIKILSDKETYSTKIIKY